MKEMNWIIHVELTRNEYKFLVRKPEGKRTLGDPDVEERKI
jgi:hypothetical protein